jgi:hypothetical protein
MEYCTVHNSTDDATFAAQKKNQGTLHSIYLYFIYVDSDEVVPSVC